MSKKTKKQKKTRLSEDNVDRKKLGLTEPNSMATSAEEKTEEVKKRKGRANRAEMAKRLIEEAEAMADPKNIAQMIMEKQMLAQRLLDAAAAEEDKKSATYFQDIARKCKEIKKDHPQIAPSTLRDICLEALEDFLIELED